MYIKLMHEEKILSEWFLKDKKNVFSYKKKLLVGFNRISSHDVYLRLL